VEEVSTSGVAQSPTEAARHSKKELLKELKRTIYGHVSEQSLPLVHIAPFLFCDHRIRRSCYCANSCTMHTNALPINSFREQIIESIARNTVTIVKGDTGSGKSSQLPQIILETSLLAHEASRGGLAAAAKAATEVTGAAGRRLEPVYVPPELWGARRPLIYVTQPRRVAAVTLAKRVADERGESPGETVGARRSSFVKVMPLFLGTVLSSDRLSHRSRCCLQQGYSSHVLHNGLAAPVACTRNSS
jgi:hypothetical protein